MGSEAHFSETDLKFLQGNLFRWWSTHSRKFPWRETKNAFHILISEVLLQRTKADQVIHVYEALVAKYPSPAELDMVDNETLKQIIYSLGLPQRVSTIKHMVRQIKQAFDGKTPDNYDDLRKLAGVGDYVASAVCCFAFNQQVIIVDTNTVRIIGRVFGISTNAESRRNENVREKHRILLDKEHPRQYNYALLDLGALICTPKTPQCNLCPICNYCEYAKSNYQQSHLED